MPWLEEEALGRLDGTIYGVLGLIGFLYSTAVFNVVLPFYSYSVHGVNHLLVLSATTLLGLYCYLCCVFLDPGRVPKGWQPEVEQQPASLEVKRGGGHRYCAKCEAYKPPRTHHCRRCRRCVLRMDHHCIWVNNCIGHGNHRVFLLMCVYLAAAAVQVAFLLFRYDWHLLSSLNAAWRGERAVRRLQGMLRRGGGGAAAAQQLAAAEAALAAAQGAGAHVEWHGPFWMHATAQIFATATALPVTLALLVLLGWNMHLLLANKTTIEHHEGVRLQLQLGESGSGSGGRGEPAGSTAARAGGAAGGAAAAASASTVADYVQPTGQPATRKPSSMNLQQLAALAAAARGPGGGTPAPSPPLSQRGGVVGATPGPSPPLSTHGGTEGATPQPSPPPSLRGGGGSAPPQHQAELAAQQAQQRPAVQRYSGDQHPYDLGWHQNLLAVCGDREGLWFLPVPHAAAGDGLAFPTWRDAELQQQRQRWREEPEAVSE